MDSRRRVSGSRCDAAADKCGRVSVAGGAGADSRSVGVSADGVISARAGAANVGRRTWADAALGHRHGFAGICSRADVSGAVLAAQASRAATSWFEAAEPGMAATDQQAIANLLVLFYCAGFDRGDYSECCRVERPRTRVTVERHGRSQFDIAPSVAVGSNDVRMA